MKISRKCKGLRLMHSSFTVNEVILFSNVFFLFFTFFA